MASEFPGSLRQLAGAAKTRFYREPRELLRKLSRWGVVPVLMEKAWDQEMRDAAATLRRPAGQDVCFPICMLTGERFWHQSAFCALSFELASGLRPRWKFVSDGSLMGKAKEMLARVIPDADFIERDAEWIESLLPASKFPALNYKRGNYVNLRKLTDVHLGETGHRLVFDSDMLFFRRPEFVLSWMNSPAGRLHMVDAIESYGYSAPLLAELAGGRLPESLNVGVFGLESDSLDWERMEHWARELVDREGESYYLEQALAALWCAGRPCAVAPRGDYLTLPSRAEATHPSAVLHHYVAESKASYLGVSWRLIWEKLKGVDGT